MRTKSPSTGNGHDDVVDGSRGGKSGSFGSKLTAKSSPGLGKWFKHKSSKVQCIAVTLKTR